MGQMGALHFSLQTGCPSRPPPLPKAVTWPIPILRGAVRATPPRRPAQDVTSLVLRLETSLQLSFRPPPGLPAPTSGQDEGEAEAKKSNRGTLVQSLGQKERHGVVKVRWSEDGL